MASKCSDNEWGGSQCPTPHFLAKGSARANGRLDRKLR